MDVPEQDRSRHVRSRALQVSYIIVIIGALKKKCAA
jgi:hypothetical protein